jgi:hypothetical protein
MGSFKDKSVKALWMFIVVVMPILGGIAYLQNRRHLKKGSWLTKSDNERVF